MLFFPAGKGMTAGYGRPASQHVRRYFGMLLMVSVLLAAIGVELSLAAGIRGESYNSFLVVPRAPILHSYNPMEIALRGLPAGFSDAHPLAPERTIRAIVVSNRRITLLAGGIPVRVIRTKVTPNGLTEVYRAVHDPSWLSVSGNRTATLSAALVTEGIRFAIGSRLKEVRLLDRPAVFIGAQGGTLSFKNLSVRGYKTAGWTAGTFRPFVEATDYAAMNITDSRFSQLGWNWLASYGVSWMSGATGRVVRSTFADNYIGAYTDRAMNLTFSHDAFRDNALYGLDPHTYSTGINVSYALAEGNKAIGFIFANHVTHSAIRDSVSRDNGEDGIMMYQNSAHNFITQDSVSHNSGDGLVVVSSPDNVFTADVASGNRVGVRVMETRPASITFEGNRIIGNGLTSQGMTLSGSNIALGNGGQWNPRVIKEIWTVLGIFLLLFSAALAVCSRRESRRTGEPIAGP
jgi:poly(beta-D-mannuronate) C5 epimerase